MICHDDYPTHVVALNVVEILVALALGVMIVGQFGPWAVMVYVAVGLVALTLSLAFGCTRCYYYGRVCGTALGKLTALIFEKRGKEEFGKSRSQTVAWTLTGVTLALPTAAGLLALSQGPTFSSLLVLTAFLGLVAAIVVTHSKLVCSHCREAREKRCTLGGLGSLRN